jgi:autotransporter translocation and assembly factor TamB
MQNIQDDDFAALISLPPEFPDVSGRHNLVVNWVGNLNLADVRFRTTHTGRWDEAPIAAQSEGSGQWTSGALTQWQIDQFFATWKDASLTLFAESNNGAFRPDQLRITMNELPVSLFWRAPEAIDGVVNGQAQLSSVDTDWVAELTLDIQAQRQTEILSGQVSLTAEGQDLELTHIDLRRLSVGFGETFAIAGQGGLDQQQWDLELNWRGLNWTPPAQWPIPPEPWQATGQLTLSGQNDNPDIQLQQEWVSIWHAGESAAVPWRLQQTVNSHDHHYMVSNQLLAADVEQVNLAVQLPRTSWFDRVEQPLTDWHWQAQAQWQIALDEWLLWFDVDQLLGAGQWHGEGEWDGPLSDLKYRLNTQWQEGSIQLPIIGLEGSDFNVQLEGNQDQAVALSGTGKLGAGEVTLLGELNLQEQPWFINSHIEFTRATLVQRPEVQSTASGQLNLHGHWPELSLTGDVSLDDLKVNLNRIAGTQIAQLEIHNEPEIEPWLPPISIDVGITTAGLAQISGNGLDAQLSGDVRLLGSPDAINTEGALTIESGQFNLLTRNFELIEGQLRLVEETIHLLIVAVHQRGDVTIEATLRGPVDALQLSLRSDPMLPEDEIVAQLLFGKTVQNMTPWQALQLASAINQLRGGDSLDLFLATRDSLGLDTLEIDTDDEAEAPAVLRIGRYLNSRVYLELDTELDADRGLTGRVELELTPNLFLETQTGGSSGRLHLRWRYDY